MKKFKRVIALILIQSFLSSGFAFARGSQISNNYLFEASDTLSPQVQIQMSQFQDLCAAFIKKESLNEKGVPGSGLFFREVAENLEQGYEKLNTLITKVDKSDDKTLIISIDGAGSAGKTMFTKLLKERGIRGLDANDIEYLSIDAMIWDLIEEDGCSEFEAFLELPIILADKIHRARKRDRLLIIEGAEVLSWMEYSEGVVPDIAVVLKVPEDVRFKRDLMRFGLFTGLRLFPERGFKESFPKGAHSLLINNKGRKIALWKFLFRTAVRTITIAVEYIIPQAWVDYAVEKKGAAKQKFISLKGKARGIFSISSIILSPLMFLVYISNELVDMYFALYPERDMVSIIKKRFGDKYIQVLDVGTGDGEFVERFQNLLDKKSVKANVTGIDIKSAQVVKAMSKGRQVISLDVKDLSDRFAEDRFDLITINAPDYPLYCVQEAMKVLKADGLLVIRLANGFHSAEDREKLIEQLKKDYEVKALQKSLHNLPNGFFYKLQKPVLISRKHKPLAGDKLKSSGRDDLSADHERIYEFRQALEKHKTSISVLVEQGRLFEASAKFLMMKGRGIDLDEEQVNLLLALKKTGDFLFQSCEYEKALRYYQEIIDIAPHETDIYFYIGAARYMQGEMHLAQVNFEKAQRGQPQVPMFILVNLMLETEKLEKSILELAGNIRFTAANSSVSLFGNSLDEHNKLLGYINYIFSERAQDIEAFWTDSEVDRMFFDRMFSDFIEHLDGFERDLGDREMIIAGQDAFRTSELSMQLKKLAKGKVIPLDQAFRGRASLKLPEASLKVLPIISITEKNFLGFIARAL